MRRSRAGLFGLLTFNCGVLLGGGRFPALAAASMICALGLFHAERVSERARGMAAWFRRTRRLEIDWSGFGRTTGAFVATQFGSVNYGSAGGMSFFSTSSQGRFDPRARYHGPFAVGGFRPELTFTETFTIE